MAEGIIATVALMAKSGLPCYGRGQPVPNLRKRFALDLSQAQAAAYMLGKVNGAYDNVSDTCSQHSIIHRVCVLTGDCAPVQFRTGFYDWVQYQQNAIPK